MSNIVGDTACPSCTANGRDTTGNHLILFEDGGAYCNRCGYKTNWKEQDLKPQERKEVSDEELKEVLSEFNSCEIKGWPKRKLKKASLERYGCRVGVCPSDKTKIGSYLMPYHTSEGKLCGYKVRLADEKRFFNQGKPKQAALFGQQLLPKSSFKKLFITEAPIDAVSLYQAIKDSWANTKFSHAEPNVVALPHGTGCAVDILSKNIEVLNRADEVILVFDSDKAGREAVDKVAALIPSVKFVVLPLKDCNDMLLEGRSEELAKLAMFSSQSFKLDGMADISELIDEIIELPKEGWSYPFKTMTELTYGLKTQQIIGICAGVGMGKTDVKNELAAWFPQKHDIHVTLFDLEYGVANTGKLLASKVAHKPFHRPDCGVTPEEIKQALEPLSGKVQLYKHRGSRDWEEIKQYMRHSVIVNNSKLVMLDPITALVAHLSSSEANDTLNTIFSDISAMTQELDFSVMYFAHLNPPKTGASHERGGKVVEAQMTGSRAMMKWSNQIWGLEGNKDPDLPEYERNVRKLVLLKDREYGNVGSLFLFYNKDTTQLIERW